MYVRATYALPNRLKYKQKNLYTIKKPRPPH